MGTFAVIHTILSDNSTYVTHQIYCTYYTPYTICIFYFFLKADSPDMFPKTWFAEMFKKGTGLRNVCVLNTIVLGNCILLMYIFVMMNG